MAVDKLVDSTALDNGLTSIANAIRTKGETSEQLAFPNGFVDAVEAISGSGNIEALSVTQNGTYTASGDVDGYSPVTVNVPTGAVIYGDTYDTSYYMESASLICTLSGRTFTKYTSDPAYVAYFYTGTYTQPVLVSESEDGVKFTTSSDGTIHTYIGTITYRNKTYYYASDYGMPGNLTSTVGFAQKLSEEAFSDLAEAAEALLDLAVFDPPHVDITANGEYPVPSGYDGYGDLTVNVSTSAHIYGDTTDPDYYMDSADLICYLSYRDYIKTTADPAYVAYFYRSDGYTGPILVSEVADGVKYTASGRDRTYGGTVTYQGTTYYYSSNPVPIPGDLTSSSGFAQKLSGTISSDENAALALLALAVFDPPHVDITANGEYPVPSGYDGYGDLTVDVQPTLGTKNIAANGVYLASADNLDGYSRVTVSVSDGGSLKDLIFVSQTQGDYVTGWYGPRTFTRSLASGAKLIAAPMRWNSGYMTAAFYTLIDYGDVSNVGSGDYAGKAEIPDVEIPNYGTATVYAYGGVNGGGRDGSCNFYNQALGGDYSNLLISMPGATTGSTYRFGPTAEADLGTAFSSMSSELQEEFLTSLLQTLN